MFRIILSILVVLLGVMHVSVSHANNDMTSPGFTIDLAPMDPLGEADEISGQGGISVLTTLLQNVAELFLFIIPMIAGVSLLFAGYYYIFSAGDSEKVGKAKTIIKWNLIAITVALLSYGIISLIAVLFTQTP